MDTARARRRRDKCDGEKRGWSGGGVEREWHGERESAGELSCAYTIRAREMIMWSSFVGCAVCERVLERQAGGRLDLRREKRSQNDRSCYTAPLRSPVPTRRTHTRLSKKTATRFLLSLTHSYFTRRWRGPLRCSLCAPRHCTQPPSLSPTPHHCPPPPPSTTSQKAPPPPVPRSVPPDSAPVSPPA